jgi:CheY-like chemotaxis protein
LNLCGNAIKFTEHGAVTLSAHFDALHQRLHLAVEDTGNGISEADLHRLFIPFHQLDDSLSRQYQGTGLGLTICKGLCEVMGGTIGVESTLGQGSRFEVSLPVTVRDSKTVAAPSFDKAQLITETQQLLAGKTLILAEDNPVNQTVALALLDKVGITTLVANDGLEVLELLALHAQIDGILMDLQMPRLDGLATCRRIKENPDWAAIPIIAMTANAMDEDRRQAHEAGMIDFVSKPISIRSLYETLREQL